MSLQSIARRLHPPVALTPTESRQLLALLTSSFRRHLDHEHASSAAIRKSADKSFRSLDVSSLSTQMATKAAESPSSMSSHLLSVLTNPLFTNKPGSRRPKSLDRPHGTLLESLQDTCWKTTAPMDWFEDQVRWGRATLNQAQYCLDAEMKALVRSPELSVHEAMKRSQAGSRVLAWLWSAGLERSGDFLRHHGFMDALMPFLVGEDHIDAVWKWLATPVTDENVDADDCGPSQSMRTKRSLLLKLVMSEIRGERGLGKAVKHFLRGSEVVLGLVDHPATFRDSHDLLAPAGRALAHHLGHAPPTKQAAVGLYDAFAKTVGKWELNSKTPLLLARLSLNHPQHPTPLPAIGLLRDVDKHPDYFSGILDPKRRARTRQRVIECSLDAARLCLNQENCTEGAWVLECARKNFPTELGTERELTATSRSTSAPQQNKAGASSHEHLHLAPS
ncbi:MAG: hypothetical protein M1817_005244 [Caeruleum heppii]|nr:MAG: hypothetical protein M1817_005244 [Caeruleum heppii]